MKKTKLKITYINDLAEDIEIGKKWVTWYKEGGSLILEGVGGNAHPCKVTKHIPLSSILFFIVEEK